MLTETPALLRAHPFLASTVYSVLGATVSVAVTPVIGPIFMFYFAASTLAAVHFGLAYGLYSTALCTVAWAFTLRPNWSMHSNAHYVSYLVITLTVQFFAARARRAMAEVREIAAQQNRFVGMVSHDLRTPLTSITMSVSILKQDATERQKRSIRRIEHGVHRMTRLVSDLLDYGRLKHERGLPLNRAEVRLSQIVDKVLRDGSALIEGQGRIYFRYDGGDDIVDADPDRVEQIIVNLISNAAKHSPARSRIDVLVTSAGPHVTFAVENEGEIPADARPTLFEPFRTGKDGSGSVGLGLYIVKQIAEAHRGHLSVETGKGKTRFTVRFHRPHWGPG